VVGIILSLFAAVGVYFRSRTDTALQVLALRQQVAILKRRLLPGIGPSSCHSSRLGRGRSIVRTRIKFPPGDGTIIWRSRDRPLE
jgi:hypothetical protein